MKKISKFFLAMLAMIVSISIAYASSGPGDAVTGRVKDAKGMPVAGAVVMDDARKYFFSDTVFTNDEYG